jgi:hypothetical protein
MPRRARAGSSGLAALVVFWAVGCGGSDGRVPVSGRLLDGGRPFRFEASKVKLPPGATGLPPGTSPVQITFIPADGGDSAGAVVDVTAWTFQVPGPDGKGLRPGKYKVALTGGVGGPDYFGGKFAADRTPVVRDVKAGEEVVVDVARPQG